MAIVGGAYLNSWFCVNGEVEEAKAGIPAVMRKYFQRYHGHLYTSGCRSAKEVELEGKGVRVESWCATYVLPQDLTAIFFLLGRAIACRASEYRLYT